MAKNSKRTRPSTTITLPPEFHETLKNVAWHVGRGVTVTGLLETGAENELKALQLKHMKGKEFPPIDPATAKSIPRSKGEKVNVTIRLDGDLLDQLKRAAWHLGVTYVSIVIAGAEKEVALFENKFNGGEPFPQREE